MGGMSFSRKFIFFYCAVHTHAVFLLLDGWSIMTINLHSLLHAYAPMKKVPEVSSIHEGTTFITPCHMHVSNSGWFSWATSMIPVVLLE